MAKRKPQPLPVCPMCEESPVMVMEAPAPIWGINVKWFGRFEVWWWKDRPQEYCEECYLQRDQTEMHRRLDAAYDAGFMNGYERAEKGL